MAAVDCVPCPVCSAPPGSLSITDRLVAKQIGSYSLAGAQMKVSTRTMPVLTCSACRPSRVGWYDDDGRHASFPATDPASEPTIH